MTQETRDEIRARCEAAIHAVNGFCAVHKYLDYTSVYSSLKDISALLDALEEKERELVACKEFAAAADALSSELGNGVTELLAKKSKAIDVLEQTEGERDRLEIRVKALEQMMIESTFPCQFCQYCEEDGEPRRVYNDKEEDCPCDECIENGGDTERWAVKMYD